MSEYDDTYPDDVWETDFPSDVFELGSECPLCGTMNENIAIWCNECGANL